MTAVALSISIFTSTRGREEGLLTGRNPEQDQPKEVSRGVSRQLYAAVSFPPQWIFSISVIDFFFFLDRSKSEGGDLCRFHRCAADSHIALG